MYNFHSSIITYFTKGVVFDPHPMSRYANRQFCHLIPFNLFIGGKDHKVCPKKRASLHVTLDLQKSIIPDSKFMLDSGAFSANRQGFDIDLNCYIEYVQEYGHLWDFVIALDEVLSAEATCANYLKMRDAGLTQVIPVYHGSRDPVEYLYKYCDLTDYVGFAPGVGSGGENYLQTVYNRLYSKDGDIVFPDHKFHGFGIGAPVFFQIYPWYSCDSSNASLHGRFGEIFYYIVNGDGAITVQELPVSDRTLNARTHYNYLSGYAKKMFDDMFAKYGFSLAHFNETLLPADMLHKGRYVDLNRVTMNALLLDDITEQITKGTIKMLPPRTRLL